MKLNPFKDSALPSIALIEPVGGHGGMDYYDYGLAYGLGENGVSVSYYTCNKTNPRSYPNVKTVICFNDLWTRSFASKTIEYLRGHYIAFRNAREEKSKIVHLHFFTFRSIDLLVLALGKLMGFKAVVTVHDVNAFDKKASRLIEKLCYALIDGVIVHNQTSLDFLVEKNINKRPTAVIPHGNYIPFITPVKEKSSSKAPLRLLFFGQIKRVKGLDVLLQAVAKVKQQGHAIHLTIGGKAWKSDLDEYRELITTLSIDDIVTTDFRYIPDEEVVNFYENADLVVLPYREIYQSGVLLLSLSYGKPVLCSDLKPFMEIVKSDETGFLFQSENADDLANQIVRLARDPAQLDLVKQKSDSIIRTNYDWVNIGTLTKGFYHKILNGQR